MEASNGHKSTVKGCSKEAARSSGSDKHSGAAKAIIASRGTQNGGGN